MISDPSGLKSVFERLHLHDRLVWTVGLTVEIKLRFRDGLVWTLGLTIEIKLRCQIPPIKCERCERESKLLLYVVEVHFH